MNTRFPIEMSKARLQSRADQEPRPGPQNDAETTRCSSMAQQPACVRRPLIVGRSVILMSSARVGQNSRISLPGNTCFYGTCMDVPPLNSQASPLRGKKMRPRLAGPNPNRRALGRTFCACTDRYTALARILLNSSQMERVVLQYSVRTPIGRLSRPSFQISTPTSLLPRMKVCDLRLSRHN